MRSVSIPATSSTDTAVTSELANDQNQVLSIRMSLLIIGTTSAALWVLIWKFLLALFEN